MNMNNSEILFYQTEDGQTIIQTRLEDETVWLTQAQMGEMFLLKVNYMKIQLFGISEQLQKMVKTMKQSTTISM